MDEPHADRPAPQLTDHARAEQQARRDREAAALRRNLLRRKAQARARADEADAAPTEPG